MTLYCYQCEQPSPILSSRSRCVHCEEKRARFNEEENDRLREQLEQAKLLLTK